MTTRNHLYTLQVAVYICLMHFVFRMVQHKEMLYYLWLVTRIQNKFIT